MQQINIASSYDTTFFCSFCIWNVTGSQWTKFQVSIRRFISLGDLGEICLLLIHVFHRPELEGPVYLMCITWIFITSFCRMAAFLIFVNFTTVNFCWKVYVWIYEYILVYIFKYTYTNAHVYVINTPTRFGSPMTHKLHLF